LASTVEAVKTGFGRIVYYEPLLSSKDDRVTRNIPLARFLSNIAITGVEKKRAKICSGLCNTPPVLPDFAISTLNAAKLKTMRDIGCVLDR